MKGKLYMCQNSDKPKAERYSINIHGGNVQINPDVHNTTINQINYSSGISTGELLSLIEIVKNTIPSALSAGEIAIVRDNLAIIEAETVSPSPKSTLLQNALSALKSIKGTVEFSAAVAALAQFVQTFS